MQFRVKLVVAFAVFGLLIATVFAVQWVYLSQTPYEAGTGEYYLDETFTASSFMYGLQSWAPYASKMPVYPQNSVDDGSGFYLMFVDLNATSNLSSTFPNVKVDYSFTGLQGTAAFHVYGYIGSSGGISWRNRVEGDGASGFYVTNSPSAENTVLEGVQSLSEYNQVYVKVSNMAGASFDDFGDDTYFMKFDKAGGGLNSLHITTEPNNPSGNVTMTDALSGSFYVDFTGSRVQEDFILMVAVNGTIGGDFGLHLRSSEP
ncbi:MAG: hypothetical protein NWF05_11225 [Candidatus Bathyarchaeota archaeon]|nr:hypothetical protein [Candidatus Bathyarchaeota archaeon]